MQGDGCNAINTGVCACSAEVLGFLLSEHRCKVDIRASIMIEALVTHKHHPIMLSGVCDAQREPVHTLRFRLL